MPPGYLLEEETHQQIRTEGHEGGNGGHNNSTQEISRNTSKWWNNYSKQKTEQEQEKILKTLCTQKNQLQHNLTTPAQQNTRDSGLSDPQLTDGGKDQPKKGPTTIKIQRHTQSQHKRQPKISKLGRSRRLYHWISQVFYHRSLHHKPRESEQINLRSRS